MARPTTARTALLIVGLPVLAAFLLWAFAWPAARIAPHDLPLGVAGQDQAVSQVEQGLAAHSGAGAFAFHWYADAGAARTGIEHREVYGAVVAGPHGLQVLTASAASPTVATMLQKVAAQAPGGHATVTDVVALPSADPHGAAFSSSVLPIVVVGLALGVLGRLAIRTLGHRLVTILTTAAAVGVIAAAVGNSWLGVLHGGFAADGGVVALMVLAVSATVCGMGSVLGHKGMGLSALVVMMLGNAWSGVSSAHELLPGAVAAPGALLPPGAGADALRDTAFFHGHAAGGPLVTLAVWAACGLGLVVLGGHLARRRQPAHAASATGAMPILVPDPVEAAHR
ncbi:ABC transporter permease [Actinacidiphila acidipaludis]|uniref:ABC transporter permease n=1 Tax=Actinacidiphila acidipaludis TaxID=2873382 RepID=A0ABS7QDR8_9ACTN|nr:ABC transporter permease [Streptomyces acidipaludis]MBY8880560.1 ABC transporter permease [Streptomyces acidipaludis]